MKYCSLFILIILSCSLWSCEKLFHPEEDNISSIDNYDELYSATYGVYGLFQECVASSVLQLPNLKGDDINIGTANYETNLNSGRCWRTLTVDMNRYNWSDWQNNASIIWNDLYRIITSANNILAQFDINSLQDKPTQTLIGELYLIRAYCFFRLTRTFGNIPIIDNIDVNYGVTKSSYPEIYQFIESDLNKALFLLPVNSNDARIPNITPHRGTAKAILAEVYLNWAGYPTNDASKYSLAAKTAKEVIDSASFFGFGLLEDLGYVWDKAHLYNSESVFSIYFQDPQIYTGQKFISWDSYKVRQFPYYCNVITYTRALFVTSDLGIEINGYPAEVKFYHDFPNGYRKDITFFSGYWERNYTWEWDSVNLEVITYYDPAYFRFDSTNTCGRVAYRKFYHDPYIIDYYTYYSVEDSSEYMDLTRAYIGVPRVYIFRYSQTLLTYAEASARSGRLNAEAVEYVNQIRRRARHLNINTHSSFDLPSGMSSETFADSVVWERAWEFADELEGRWFDLVRLEKVEDLPKLRDPYEEGPPSSPITKGCYFSPIPGSEKILNPNLNE